jgi:hypothetical protein
VRQLDLTLEGGTAELFKFPTGTQLRWVRSGAELTHSRLQAKRG